MNWLTILILTVVFLLLLLGSGMRIAFALVGLAFLVLYLWMPAKEGLVLGLQTWAAVDSFILCAIPLFVLMSEIIFRCGLSERIYDSISPILDHFPGGLLHSNIVAGAVLAACTGSTIASTATIGTVALPEMEKRGYDRTMAMGSIAAGAVLAPLIPPSTIMVIYGAMVNVSVGKLFIAGVIPGIMLAVLFLLYTGVRVALKPSLAPKAAGGSVPWSQSLRGMVHVWPVIILVIAVLGSIYAGVATPTEAAAVGCLWAFLLAALYRQFKWKVIKKAAVETAKVTSMVILIYLGSKLMAAPLVQMGVFSSLTRWIIGLPVPPLGILLGILLMYLILGCFMSGLPVIVITLPITFPIVMALGYDPVWFGVINVLMDEAGVLTPPVGTVIFVLQSLRPNYPFKMIAAGCTEYFIMVMVLTAILIAFPPLATWLPALMIGK